MSSDKAMLALEDGSVFEGVSFARRGDAWGEAAFYTGVAGYEDLLTDPASRGLILTFTYPILGSYGVNGEDSESDAVHVRGIVIGELSRTFSNFRATRSLEDWLAGQGVAGIRGVDTRAVAIHLRDHGEMAAAIVPSDADPAAVAAELSRRSRPSRENLAREATWTGSLPASGPERRRVALVNLGVTRSLLAQLADLGCAVDVLSEGSTAGDILARRPDRVILAGGPGDPALLDNAVETARSLAAAVPVFGAGLGHLVLARALGCRTLRMTAGHRGANCPVRDLASGVCAITSQNHGYVVDEGGLPAGVEVTHRNLTDGTVEGLRARNGAVRSLQFCPGRDEMERPSALLQDFCEHG